MDNKSLSHIKLEMPVSHIMFIPKYRKKVLYGEYYEMSERDNSNFMQV